MRAKASGVWLSTNATIRAARPNDATAIWDILRPVFRAGDTYTVDPKISRDDALAYWSAHQTFVAEIDGEILGTYYMRPNQQGGGSHVCNCGYATAPKAQGRGIARAMLHHSFQAATDAGYEAMQFNFVLANNTRAVDTWKRAGFTEIGCIPKAFKMPDLSYVDAYIFYKFLE